MEITNILIYIGLGVFTTIIWVLYHNCYSEPDYNEYTNTQYVLGIVTCVLVFPILILSMVFDLISKK